MKKLFRWLIVLWFVVYSALFTPLAYAASAGGWAFSSFDVATSVVTAMKNGASASVAVAKSPISQKIAKGIVGGAIVGAAIPLAISQISGLALNAVDWVLDPANNAISYDAPAPVVEQYRYKIQGGNHYPTIDAACRSVPLSGKLAGYTYTRYDYLPDLDRYLCQFTSAQGVQYPSQYYVYKVSNPAYDPTAPTTVKKSIPISTVADKIYDNAKTDAASASVVNQAVKDYVNEGSADVALDAAKADADATHNCGTGTHWSGSACVADTPTTPSTPTTPDTPFDPTSIIDAIGKVFDAVMSLPDVINNALDALLVDIKDFVTPLKDAFVDEYKSVKDWVQGEPEPSQDTPKPDIDTTPPTKSATDFDTDYLRFGGQCPATPSTSLSVGAVSVPLSIDLTPLCDFVVMVRPAILAMAYLSALFVVARAIGETQ